MSFRTMPKGSRNIMPWLESVFFKLFQFWPVVWTDNNWTFVQPNRREMTLWHHMANKCTLIGQNKKVNQLQWIYYIQLYNSILTITFIGQDWLVSFRPSHKSRFGRIALANCMINIVYSQVQLCCPYDHLLKSM